MLAAISRSTEHAIPRAQERGARSAGLLLLLGAGANQNDSERLKITPDEALRILEAKEREMAVGGRRVPSAHQTETRQCAKPPLLDQACVARARDRNHEATTRPDIADEPGSLVDGAGAARDDDSAAVTATRSAAASLRQSSPQAPPAFLRDGSTGEAHRDTFTASSAEYYHDDGDSGNDIQASVLQSAPDRRRGDCLFEVGDEILVERRLRWARRMPLAERRARRYSKPQSCVG